MRLIKKYPNRRLYDTEKSSYITLAEVREIVRGGGEFKVVDANSGDDITRSVLVQIITEQESGERPIMSTDMLMKFIRFYDDTASSMFGDFLDRNMAMFTEQQKRFTEQVGGIMGGAANPLPKMMQDVTERNMAMWQDMQKSFLDIATGGIGAGKKATSSDTDDKKKSEK